MNCPNSWYLPGMEPPQSGRSFRNHITLLRRLIPDLPPRESGTVGGARTHTAGVKVPCAAITLRRCICSTGIAPEPVARSGFYELPDIFFYKEESPFGIPHQPPSLPGGSSWSPEWLFVCSQRLRCKPRVILCSCHADSVQAIQVGVHSGGVFLHYSLPE